MEMRGVGKGYYIVLLSTLAGAKSRDGCSTVEEVIDVVRTSRGLLAAGMENEGQRVFMMTWICMMVLLETLVDACMQVPNEGRLRTHIHIRRALRSTYRPSPW